jgi:hypothetical protein
MSKDAANGLVGFMYPNITSLNALEIILGYSHSENSFFGLASHSINNQNHTYETGFLWEENDKFVFGSCYADCKLIHFNKRKNSNT